MAGRRRGGGDGTRRVWRRRNARPDRRHILREALHIKVVLRCDGRAVCARERRREQRERGAMRQRGVREAMRAGRGERDYARGARFGEASAQM